MTVKRYPMTGINEVAVGHLADASPTPLELWVDLDTDPTGGFLDPREVGYAINSGSVSGIAASAVRIVGINAVVFKTGHKYKLTATWRALGGTVNNDIFAFYIGFGASPGGGNGAATNAELAVPMPNSIVGTAGGTLVGRYLPGSDITQDAWLYCVRSSGTGTGTVIANGTSGPMQFFIEDIT